MLWNTITTYLQSWFDYTGNDVQIILLCAALALVFGIIWLVAHRAPFFSKPSLWLVAIFSALLTVVATGFIYITLNYYYSQWLGDAFSAGTLADWMLLWSIPIVLVAGLVQEGAKMIPMLFAMGGAHKPDPKMGVVIGAAAGAGFGIFEAFWGFNQVFGAGWGWNQVTAGGVTALLPFWIQFWMVAFHIGISAIVGYGLAKGKGGGFYLLAAFLHALVSYFTILAVNGNITNNQLGIIVAIAGAVIIGISLWLRWRRAEEETPTLREPPAPPPPELPRQEIPPPAPPRQEIPPPDRPTMV